MAYISTEDVKQIRQKLRKEFPNLKLSVRCRNYSTLDVTILSGDIDFINENNFETKRNYIQVNHFYIDRDFNGKSKEILNKIKSIIVTQKPYYDRNAGDMGADYCDYTFYYDISIGSWDRPYELKIR